MLSPANNPRASSQLKSSMWLRRSLSSSFRTRRLSRALVAGASREAGGGGAPPGGGRSARGGAGGPATAGRGRSQRRGYGACGPGRGSGSARPPWRPPPEVRGYPEPPGAAVGPERAERKGGKQPGLTLVAEATDEGTHGVIAVA